MNKVDYFTKAESWAVNSQVSDSRSKRTAWIVAGVAAGIAMLEAVALAMLVPLKTVQPITLLVDRQTGHVQAVDPLRPSPVAADEALTQSFLAQYVTARESFDRATVSADYRRVALWSAGRARTSYLAEMPATNPASPFQRYPGGTVVSARVKSVSMLHDGTALVRFDAVRQDPSGAIDTGQPWVAVIRYRFANAPMPLQDRLINPLGFQVVSYRRDAEAPPVPAPQTQPGVQSGAAANRNVPLDQLPPGSPLGVGGP
jgi:type IV secretion system protein VirB8